MNDDLSALALNYYVNNSFVRVPCTTSSRRSYCFFEYKLLHMQFALPIMYTPICGILFESIEYELHFWLGNIFSHFSYFFAFSRVHSNILFLLNEVFPTGFYRHVITRHVNDSSIALHKRLTFDWGIWRIAIVHFVITGYIGSSYCLLHWISIDFVTQINHLRRE